MQNTTFRKVPTCGGGDCFFRALSIILYGNQSKHRQLRSDIVQYIFNHRESSMFAHISFSSDTRESVNDYCMRMSRSQQGRRHGEYADEFVIAAAAEYLKRPLHIISSEFTYQGIYGSSFSNAPMYMYYGANHFTALTTTPRKVTPYSRKKNNGHIHSAKFRRRSERLRNKNTDYRTFF